SAMNERQSGFTLVELLVTIAIVGITTASLASMFISIQKIQHQTLHVDGATRAAQREIESLRNDNYASLTPGQTINFTSQLPDNLPPGSSGTVQVSQPSNDLRRVDVTVTYKENGKQRNITLSSLIGVIGITQ
ncbi:MAG TPA: type II secretion system protein, partial [Candidatus Saccharimonadales bacterium]|nr:type II secretion system protein [Candidatus Saccharimonadales bacterium]